MTDLINGSFELFASLFIFLHIRRVFIDKEVKGVSITATAFFMLWGYWNLYYYPSLNQWCSFAGGVSVVSMNTIWVYGLWRYR